MMGRSSVAEELKESYEKFGHVDPVSRFIRLASTSAREQQQGTHKTIVKFQKTAIAVLGLIPDLTMAVEEREPGLCHDIFQQVTKWVREMKADTLRAQERYVKITMEETPRPFPTLFSSHRFRNTALWDSPLFSTR